MPEQQELDPTKLAIPTVVHEALMLPLSAHEVGLLQGMIADWKKRNPFRAKEPATLRLETKLAFLLMIVLALGNQPELQVLGRQKLAEIYQLLDAQKQKMEAADGK